jgi:hypothetical protein
VKKPPGDLTSQNCPIGAVRISNESLSRRITAVRPKKICKARNKFSGAGFNESSRAEPVAH